MLGGLPEIEGQSHKMSDQIFGNGPESSQGPALRKVGTYRYTPGRTLSSR